MHWTDTVAKAAQEAATPRRKPPEAIQTEMSFNEADKPENATEAEGQQMAAPDRAALLAAIEKGRTAHALNLALRVIADLTGDMELIDANDNSRAAMGEEWRRAYKVWATYAPRIRAAHTAAEELRAYDKAIDACAGIADGTGLDGVLLGGAVLDMLDQIRKDRP